MLEGIYENHAPYKTYSKIVPSISANCFNQEPVCIFDVSKVGDSAKNYLKFRKQMYTFLSNPNSSYPFFQEKVIRKYMNYNLHDVEGFLSCSKGGSRAGSGTVPRT